MTTYAELLKQIDELKAKAESQRITEKTKVIAEIKEKIAAYDLTAKDLGLANKSAQNTNGTKSKKATKSVAAKYRHPANQRLTWSGRGRQPRWVTTWISEGANRKVEDLLIK